MGSLRTVLWETTRLGTLSLRKEGTKADLNPTNTDIAFDIRLNETAYNISTEKWFTDFKPL